MSRLFACLAAALFACSFGARAAGTAVEYFHAGFGHYFMTAFPEEAASLDAHPESGWARTGKSFAVETQAGAGLSPVCRFFSDAFPPKSSHFYTPYPGECTTVKANPTWKYEAIAFQLQLPDAAGRCPAGTTVLYRLYNNGMNGAPNHRYTTDAALFAAMKGQGWTAEGDGTTGAFACTPGAGPVATAVGTPNGSRSSASIGPAGGSVSSADGVLTVTVPAGALAATTTVAIQPITNSAPGRIGSAYRLSPEGTTFATPVTLTFAYADGDLAGTSSELLGVAAQTSQGYWQWAAAPTLDAAARKVTAAVTHFSDWSLVKGMQLRPGTATVKVGGTVALRALACYWVTDAELAPLGYSCDSDSDLEQLPAGATDWSVNGQPGGNGAVGTVAGGISTATYSAPQAKPTPNVVAVSARVPAAKGALVLVVSNITITDATTWSGTSSSDADGIRASAQVVWTLASRVNNVETYQQSGTATLEIAGCTLIPPTTALGNTGWLVIDYNANPPTYSGYGSAIWNSSIVCPPNPATPLPPIGHVYFGGNRGTTRLEAQGTLSPDGKTIEGTSVLVDSAIVRFKFTKD